MILASSLLKYNEVMRIRIYIYCSLTELSSIFMDIIFKILFILLCGLASIY